MISYKILDNLKYRAYNRNQKLKKNLNTFKELLNHYQKTYYFKL